MLTWFENVSENYGQFLAVQTNTEFGKLLLFLCFFHFTVNGKRSESTKPSRGSAPVKA
jgi:hypothetical protein